VKSYSIAVISGDGIGNEVVPAAISCLDALAEHRDLRFGWEYLPWGTDFYARTGVFMPEDGVERLKKFDAIFFGAVGSPTVSDADSLWGLLIPIRRGLGQCINLRPIRSVPGVAGPLSAHPDDIDLVIVRENSEGEYSEVGGRFQRGTAGEFAVQNAIFTRPAIERVTRYAAEIAQQRRGTLTSATKSNGIVHTNTLWDDVVDDVIARDYPALTVDRVLVDALAARLILKPQSVDVIVASNLYGDILSDLAAGLAGSIGVAASGNINPDETGPSMFEPVHGSAPDIAGQGIANPVGQLYAGVMMLEHLGESEAAADLTAAVDAALGHGIRTRDLGGSATTDEFAVEVIQAWTR
jgi:tartrate dehydrogenase/decarboxylase/D-malate dehydrogenase